MRWLLCCSYVPNLYSILLCLCFLGDPSVQMQVREDVFCFVFFSWTGWVLRGLINSDTGLSCYLGRQPSLLSDVFLLESYIFMSVLCHKRVKIQITIVLLVSQAICFFACCRLAEHCTSYRLALCCTCKTVLQGRIEAQSIHRIVYPIFESMYLWSSAYRSQWDKLIHATCTLNRQESVYKRLD